MEVGPLIKLHRVKQNMKQEELAKGIVSESYLSKIENQKTTANPDVIKMLCNRLGVRLDDEISNDQLSEKCQKWFLLLTDSSRLDEIKEIYEELCELIDTHLSEVDKLFEINKIRYYIVTDEQEKAYEQIITMKRFKNTFSDTERYYWYKYVGNYHTVIQQYSRSLHYYKLAEEHSKIIDLDEEERADLNYSIAHNHSELRNSLEVIDYINQALAFYRKNYHLSKCAHGHILLGKAYQSIRIFDKAVNNFNLANDLAKISKNSSLKRLIHINLGNLHASRKEPKKAIDYYLKVLNDNKATESEKLIAITCLSQEYYNLNQLDNKKQIINQGLKIIEEQKSMDDKYLFYYYKLKTHYYLMNDQIEDFEKIVVDRFIPYLLNQNDLKSLITYGTMLGDHFSKQKKYKYASYYYKLANQSYEQIVEI